MLAAKGAELLLHGHDHRSAILWLEGPSTSKIPAIGVASASASAAHGGEDAAGYHLFHIDNATGPWCCEMIARRRDTDGVVRDVKQFKLR